MRFLVSVALAVAVCPQLAAQGIASQYTRPAYQVLRQNEIWVAQPMQQSQTRGDLFDPIKHVALSADGSVWASFGGQVRARFEQWNNFGFGGTGNRDDSFLLTRLLIHSDIHLGERVRIFVEGKSALSTDRNLPGGQRAIDADRLDLQNGFAEVSLPLSPTDKWTLRAGRQELLFGKQRLVSPLDWANSRRTFDGVTTVVKLARWAMTGFWARPVQVRATDFNQSVSSTDFFGIYTTRSGVVAGGNLDLYVLGLRRDSVEFNGTAGPSTLYTLGGRIHGAVPTTSFDYDIETAYQAGEVGNGNIAAYMLATQVGYRPGGRFAPRVYGGFDYASGDGQSGGSVGTFNQLFPLGHAYLGYIDAVGRQNGLALSTGISAVPIGAASVAVEGHFFQQANSADALYHAGGGVLRAGTTASSSKLGSEVDVTTKYRFDRHALAVFGYSHFFTGSFMRESGASENIDFAYLSFQYTF